MAKQFRCASDDEQPEAQSVSVCCIDSMKGVEYPSELLRLNSNTGVVNLDVDFRSAAPAAEQHTAARRRVFDAVTEEISQDARQQGSVAQHGGAGPATFYCNLLLLGGFGEFLAQLRQQRTEPNRHELARYGPFPEPCSLDKSIELLGQLRNCPLSELDVEPPGSVDVPLQQGIDADKRLQRLAEVMPGHRQHHRIEVVQPSKLTFAIYFHLFAQGLPQ